MKYAIYVIIDIQIFNIMENCHVWLDEPAHAYYSIEYKTNINYVNIHYFVIIIIIIIHRCHINN